MGVLTSYINKTYSKNAEKNLAIFQPWQNPSHHPIGTWNRFHIELCNYLVKNISLQNFINNLPTESNLTSPESLAIKKLVSKQLNKDFTSECFYSMLQDYNYTTCLLWQHATHWTNLSDFTQTWFITNLIYISYYWMESFQYGYKIIGPLLNGSRLLLMANFCSQVSKRNTDQQSFY